MSKMLTNILSIALLGATLALGYLNFHNYPVTSAEGMLVTLIFTLTGALLGYVVHLIRNENVQCLLHLFTLGVVIDFSTLLTTKAVWIGKFAGGSHSLPSLALLVLSFFLIFLFFLSIKRNLSLILFVSYFVFFTSTLLLPAPSMPFGEQKTDQSAHNNGDSPGTLHLVLDGHIGIAGIPTSIDGGIRLKQRLAEFYKKWGFQLHENAYSQHALSQDSLSTLFNGTSNITEKNQLASGHTTGHRFKLTENKYFEKQAQAGYEIRIIQSDYLDFCNSDRVPIAYCYDYPAVSPGAMNTAVLPILLKTKRLIRSFFNNSLFVILINKIVNNNRTIQTDSSVEANQHVPVKYFNTALIHSIELIKKQLQSHPDGSLIFAHLLMPHAPFIWDSQCNIRLENKLWLPKLVRDHREARNAIQVRNSNYLNYFNQIDCIIKQLDELFTELSEMHHFSDLRIIIHSDHGSRLSLINPTIDNMETVTNTYIIDSFSTIFAIREPAHTAGSSREQISLLELFSDYNLVENDLNPQVSGAPIWFRTQDSVADEILRKKYDKLPFD